MTLRIFPKSWFRTYRCFKCNRRLKKKGRMDNVWGPCNKCGLVFVCEECFRRISKDRNEEMLRSRKYDFERSMHGWLRICPKCGLEQPFGGAVTAFDAW